MEKNINYRASVLFPIFQKEGVTNRLNFLSYWKFKNKLENVLMQLSFRSKEGNLVNYQEIEILGDPRSYDLNLNEFIEPEIDPTSEGFTSYVEVEVFFEKEPFIKYPALIYTLDNNSSCSAVHSCLRCYNPSEKVPKEIHKTSQTGFDIFFDKGTENYIVFIGGDTQKVYNLNLKILSSHQEIILQQDIKLLNQGSKKLFNIMINDFIKNHEFNKKDSYKVSITHDIEDVFPRFYVGNFSNNRLPTLTHTFFDESNLRNKVKLPVKTENQHLAGSFTFPVLKSNLFVTSLSSYMANRKWHGTVKVKLFDIEGKELDQVTLSDYDFKIFQEIGKISVNELFNTSNIKDNTLFCKFELYSNNFPERFKLGLNIGRIGNINSGTNICFSPPIYNEETLKKEVSSTWCPIGGSTNFEVFFQNTWMMKEKKVTKVEALIFSKNGEKLSFNFDLQPDASIVLSVSNDSRIKDFLKGTLGYVFFRSENPFFSSWYLSIRPNGIGGDHAF